MKKCAKCGITKPREDFYHYFEKKFSRVRTKSVCKQCQNVSHRTWNKANRTHVNAYAVRWSREWRKNPENRKKIHGYVKKFRENLKERINLMKKTDTEKYRRYQLGKHLRRKFKIGIAVYDALVKKQAGRCGMCKCEPSLGKRLDVDHDHKTGKVRGLLCQPCNRTLHYVEEHAWRLKLGRKYLEECSEDKKVPEMWLPLGESDESSTLRKVS
jgi:hypothetical protein